MPSKRHLLGYPDELLAKGNFSLEQIFAFNAERGEYGPGNVADLVKTRMVLVAKRRAHVF